MKRVLFPILLMLVTAGCANTPPAENPFLSPATVPPPGTGSAGSAPPAALYYPPVRQPGGAPLGSASRFGPASGASSPSGPVVERTKVVAVPRRDDRVSGSAMAGSAALNRTSSPRDQIDTRTPSGAKHVVGGVASSNDPQWAGSGTIRTASGAMVTAANDDGERSDGAAKGKVSAAVASSTIRVVEPEPGRQAERLAATSAGRADVPGRFEPPTELIDITELPLASGASSTRAPGGQPESTLNDVSSARRGAGQALSTSDVYDHDKNYGWLKGKLERSRVDGRWKLRYIPIDGDTDRFGGSVVLGHSPLLEGYEPGQFVAVEGDLDDKKPADYGFAPSYSIHRVASLEP